ncbi:hypothetical protein DAKH74_047480 [Maudiozyma humilis]|uniref:Uncharacterized protein n=1 Tax=Maudiozyma humilis TaxID=51915 RepID=A0AAV5S5L9_MAUHU|nr:hypothetical protein DAKH74_047480 [Kazachstania humilis]
MRGPRCTGSSCSDDGSKLCAIQVATEIAGRLQVRLSDVASGIASKTSSSKHVSRRCVSNSIKHDSSKEASFTPGNYEQVLFCLRESHPNSMPNRYLPTKPAPIAQLLSQIFLRQDNSQIKTPPPGHFQSALIPYKIFLSKLAIV